MRKLIVTMLLCGVATPCFAQDVSAVKGASARFASAMASADVPTVISLFSEDAVVLPPGRAELTTKSDIQSFLGGMTRSVQNLQFTSEDIRPLGDGAAREIGSLSFKSRGANAQDVRGKYVLVWVKSGSDWQISTDMWNRSSGAQARGRSGRGGAQGGQVRGKDSLTPEQ